MSDTAKRDAVMAEFKRPYFGLPDTYALIDEIVRLRDENTAFRAEINRLTRILAALREPSEAVVMGAHQQLRGLVPGYLVPVIPAAVKVAEQEVGRE